MRGQNNNAIAQELVSTVPQGIPQPSQQQMPQQMMPQQQMPQGAPPLDPSLLAGAQYDQNGQLVLQAPMPQMPQQHAPNPQVGAAINTHLALKGIGGESQLSQADVAYLAARVPQLVSVGRRVLAKSGPLSPAQKNYIATQAAIALVGDGDPGFELARRYALRIIG